MSKSKKAPFRVVFHRKVPSICPGEFYEFPVEYPCYSREQAFKLCENKMAEYFDTTIKAGIYDVNRWLCLDMQLGKWGMQ